MTEIECVQYFEALHRYPCCDLPLGPLTGFQVVEALSCFVRKNHFRPLAKTKGYHNIACTASLNTRRHDKQALTPNLNTRLRSMYRLQTSHGPGIRYLTSYQKLKQDFIS